MDKRSVDFQIRRTSNFFREVDFVLSPYVSISKTVHLDIPCTQ